MESIRVEKTDQGEDIIFEGLKGYVRGNYIGVLSNGANNKPIVKFHMKRKKEESTIGTSYGVRCVYDGLICVILFPK